jgi:photosystem II stability/assembly factor-like uncharacterized protein
MTDWKTYKDQPPWPLTLQPHTQGYLNNPRWTSTATAKHEPCGYWFGNFAVNGDNIPVKAWTSLAISASGQYRTLACTTGIYWSNNFGYTWYGIFRDSQTWSYASMSTSGQYQVIGATDNGETWRSNDYGVTWYQVVLPAAVEYAAFSNDGKYQLISLYTFAKVYKSSDYGENWTLAGIPAPSAGTVFISSDGKYQMTCRGRVSYSSNYGVSFTETDVDGYGYIGIVNMSDDAAYNLASTAYYDTVLFYGSYGSWYQIPQPSVTGKATEIAISSTGQYQAITWNKAGRYVWVSTNYGVTWTKTLAVSSAYVKLNMSDDGQYLSVLNSSGGTGIMLSSDFGQTWQASNAPGIPLTLKTMSSSGQYQMVTGGVNSVYLSSDYGASWATHGTGYARGQNYAKAVWPMPN